MARANTICNMAREIGAATYLARANPVTGHNVADDAARAMLAKGSSRLLPAGMASGGRNGAPARSGATRALAAAGKHELTGAKHLLV